jgi:hypothetical protein
MTKKLLCFPLQKAVMDSTVAFAHFEKATKFDGHGAYFHLHNAYTMAGLARSAVLLQELALFRLDSGERLAVFCARLQKLFADLSGPSGENKMVFSDVQKRNYLLTAIRHDPDLKETHVNLQSKQVSGEMDFTTAIHTLERRCERAPIRLYSTAREVEVDDRDSWPPRSWCLPNPPFSHHQL